MFFKQKVNQHYTDKKSIPYKDYWENIGYHFGSIIALSYYSYISQHFNSNKDELIFVGRDGYSLKLFFDILKGWISVKLLTTLIFYDPNSLEFINMQLIDVLNSNVTIVGIKT